MHQHNGHYITTLNQIIITWNIVFLPLLVVETYEKKRGEDAINYRKLSDGKGGRSHVNIYKWLSETDWRVNASTCFTLCTSTEFTVQLLFSSSPIYLPDKSQQLVSLNPRCWTYIHQVNTDTVPTEWCSSSALYVNMRESPSDRVESIFASCALFSRCL